MQQRRFFCHAAARQKRNKGSKSTLANAAGAGRVALLAGPGPLSPGPGAADRKKKRQ